MKDIIIYVYWQHYAHANQTQLIYSSHCLANIKPSLRDMLTAIHCTLVAPTGLGIQFGTGMPHRPKHIVFTNRWGAGYFDAARSAIYEACRFQSREELERICREEGSDPDGTT